MTDYKAIADDDIGGDIDAAVDALRSLTVTVKPTGTLMINERTILGALGIADGDAFMSAIEASPSVPDRVKAWFKPDQQGVDILNAETRGMIQAFKAAGVLSQAQEDTLLNLGVTTQPKYANLQIGQLIDARRMRSAGEI